MPKNPVTEPITDQEIAFARLILSGTMNDRRAAEAVGLKPSTADYTKSKPSVRAYMIEYRAAVSEKPVDQVAEGLPTVNKSRDQILVRLWQLANLSPEATRGSIAGQIKAMSMIVAIEGLIPNGRPSPAPAQPAAPLDKPQFYVAERFRPQQHQDDDTRPEDVATIDKAQPAAPPVPEPEPPAAPNEAPPPDLGNHPSPANPSMHPEPLNWTPAATGYAYDTIINTAGPLSLSMSPKKGFFNRGRSNR